MPFLRGSIHARDRLFLYAPTEKTNGHNNRPLSPFGSVDTGEWARDYPDTKHVRLAGKSINVLHDFKTLKADPGAGIDVIVSGHSHMPKIHTVSGVLYLNPGSAGPRRFKLPITLATFELTPDGMRAEIHELGGD